MDSSNRELKIELTYSNLGCALTNGIGKVKLGGEVVHVFVRPNEQRLSDAAAMLEEGTALHGVR